jgi:uncharacterized protein (TIGR03905 family)
MTEINYKPKGVCCQQMNLVIEDNRLLDVQFIGGCHGNTQGVAALAKGNSIDVLIKKLEGIKCMNKPTSCPDQLAQALKAYKEQN